MTKMPPVSKPRLEPDMWKVKASTALLDYAHQHPVFTAEKAWAFICELYGEPDSVAMKGYLFREVLIKPGHLLDLGTERAASVQAKGRKVTRWKSKLSTNEYEVVTAQQALNDIRGKVSLRKITLGDALNAAYELGVKSMQGVDWS